MDRPRYGTPNVDYVKTWFKRTEDGPMWALNLMKYRAVAEYFEVDGPTISGAEADDLYAPLGPLAEVGARVLVAGDVVHQLSGDSIAWDRVAVAQYPRRMAMIEMQNLPAFQKQHVHKDAGMEFTIVMATFPQAGTIAPTAGSTARTDDVLLVQVAADPTAFDFATLVPSRRLGSFDVEGVIVGDERAWSQARWDVISRASLPELVAASAAHVDSSIYAVVIDARLDRMAESIHDHLAS